MLIIKVQKGNIEKALKQMRRKFVKTQTMKDLRTQKYYKKPSEKRREQLEKAKNLSKWKIDHDEE
jgi:small subunit ribosomal protein S21|tara:strand:+ start:1072 stop:1266 length:195 start_codon:yes stop_codon:yes gene_type:complete